MKERKKFLKILREVFPMMVQRNIKLYIVLNEISSIIEKNSLLFLEAGIENKLSY